LIRNSRPKNRDIRRYSSFRLRRYAVCMIATSGARPIVSGTKMKW
jgi:hypothetical protein